MNERITENIVRKHFAKHIKFDKNKQINIEEQNSSIPKISKLLRTASKSGPGAGFPEFIISFPPPYSDLVIVVECKADIKKHESKKRDIYKDYSVDGALLYSSYLSRNLDVISIAVSGIGESNLKISNFLQLKGESQANELSSKDLLSVDDYLKLYLFDPKKEKQNYNTILKFASELNEKLRTIDLSESHRPLLVSGILIALEDGVFINSYTKEERPSDLAKLLINSIEKVLDKQNIQGFKKDNMRQSYGFIGTHSRLANPVKEKDGKFNDILSGLIHDIEEKVFSFTKTYKYYDILGKFYSEFLRYANGDKGLGIVLTPQHITELFVDMADINENSVILDNCAGTAGFLISAMKKMISLCNGDTNKEKKIYNKQLIGVESQSNMFSLACSNMMIRGDGKSNIYYGSCFDLVEDVKKHKPNVGLLNPPYSKKGDNVSEWDYILNNLSCLEQNSLCLAIIPISCVIDDPMKEDVINNHTLEAVLSMPEDLFHDSDAGTVTCIVVIKAHVKHPKNKKTWFGYCRDDGFFKVKNKGRIDINESWNEIKNVWLSSYKNREPVKNISLMQCVSVHDEWCAEAYMKTDYSNISEEEFTNTVKKYLGFKISGGIR